MTIASTTSRVAYTGSGSVNTYSFPFKIFNATDLLVTRLDLSGNQVTLAYPTDYTVTGVGSSSGGSITLTAGALVSGWTIVIRRNPPLTQLTDIRNQSAFYPEAHENEFDQLVMIDQAQQDVLNRAVVNPETLPASTFNPTLPVGINTGSVTLVTKSDGTGFAVGPSTSAISAVAPAAAAAAASATAAAGSATTAAGSATAAATSATAAAGSATSAATSATSAAGSAATITGQLGAHNGIAQLDANGLVPLTQIPAAALETIVTVANQAARYALTTASVQNGDTVLQSDLNEMFMVIDQTNLGNSAGYQIYSAGTSVNFTGSLSGEVTGTQGATVMSTAAVTAKVLTGLSTTAGTVTATDTILSGLGKTIGNDALKAPIASPTFTGTVTAPTFSGALSGNATTATTATNFSGSLVGDVTGTQGATVVAGATATSTASTIMKRDANKNVNVNTVVEALLTVVTAAGTTTLTAASAPFILLTGTTTQTVVLPDATTLSVNQPYTINNRSTGAVTVNYNGGALALTVVAGTQATFTLTANGTAAGTWDLGGNPVFIDGTDPTKQIKFNAGTQNSGKVMTLQFDSQTGSTAISVTVPSQTDTLVNTAGSQTLSGKTISTSNNTIKSTGASANTFLKADGSGNTSWASAAGTALALASKTAAYTLTTSDDIILADSSGGAFTLTLPTSVGNSGKIFRIKKTDTSTNAITIATTSSQTIDGVTTSTINTQYEILDVVADGANFQILKRDYNKAWTTYTPTGSWSTNTTYTGAWRRVGDEAEYVIGITLAGAPTAANLTINLLSGHVMDTTKMAFELNNEMIIGLGQIRRAASNTFPVLAQAISTATSSVAITSMGAAGTNVDTASAAVTATSPATWAATDKFQVRFSLPIVGWK